MQTFRNVGRNPNLANAVGERERYRGKWTFDATKSSLEMRAKPDKLEMSDL